MRQRTTVYFRDIEWSVEGVYRRGRPAINHLGIGNPGYPAEPSELLDVTITIKTKFHESDDLHNDLTQETYERIINIALEAFDDPDFMSDDDIPL